MKRRATIVTIGGGTGHPIVLEALLRFTRDVTDNGGHSGVVRHSLGLPQVGDLRNCLAALVPKESPWKTLLGHRFSQGELDGVALGNLVLAAFTVEAASLFEAASRVRGMAGIKVPVLPVSDGNAHICAELVDGRVIEGEWEIIRRVPRTEVRRLFHRPALRARPEVLEAVRAAKGIVLAPGSLRTGIISVLLAEGMREAFEENPCPKVYVMNIVCQPGNSDGFTAKRHVEEIARYLGHSPDRVIVNEGEIPADMLEHYRRQGCERVVDDLGRAPGYVYRGDLVERAKDWQKHARAGAGLLAGPHFIRHDAKCDGFDLVKLARARSSPPHRHALGHVDRREARGGRHPRSLPPLREARRPCAVRARHGSGGAVSAHPFM